MALGLLCKSSNGVIHLEPERTRKMSKKAVLISQLLMTFMMALSMSGIMSLIELGPTRNWLSFWPREFAIAWPTAFILTMIAWPAALTLTGVIAKEKPQER